MTELLRELCSLRGVSGREDAVREFILTRLPREAEHYTDALGNLIVFKKGARTPKNKILLAAHMDEVGFMVSFIRGDGLLKFANVGGIDEKVFLGSTVLIGENRVPGAVGVKPIHFLESDEERKMPKRDALYIDIGASSREEAEKIVHVGDSVTFDSDFVCFGDGFIKSRALDDRAGCAVLLEILNSDLPVDITAAFTVQEEVGCRGAGAAAFEVRPDIAVVVETTTAADIAGVEEENRACALGHGAVISFMDRATVYDTGLFNLALETAAQNGIAVQVKTVVAGGNDSSAIHKTAGGVKTLAVSLPCRYLHSPSCVIKESDAESVRELISTLIEKEWSKE